MKRVITSAATLAFLFMLPAVNAKAADSALDSSQTVQSLFQACKVAATPHAESDPDASYCLGYISAVGDFLKVIPRIPSSSIQGICGNASYGAAVQAFSNWAAAHPEEWTEPRLLGVAKALRQTWPCKKPN